jgi:nicotinate-nucleotide adenylyltransferase
MWFLVMAIPEVNPTLTPTTATQAKVLWGGTFDPIHQGHVLSAMELSRCLGVKTVELLPNRQPAHRQNPVATAQQRAKMVSLAIEAHDELAMDTREVERQGPSYSVLTMAEVRQEIGPVMPLIWCMGTDAFAGLQQWHRWQELLDYGHVLVLTRPASFWPQDPELLTWYATHKVDDAKCLLAAPSGQVAHLKLGQHAVSATQIRQQLGLGYQPSATELAPAVAQYIASQSLYGIN